MKKFAILVGLMALALVIGVMGTSFRAEKAAAKPTTVLAFNQNICAAFTHTGAYACYHLDDPHQLKQVAEALDGNVDDPATYKILVDATAGQLGDDSQNSGISNTQNLWVLTFVSNDADLVLGADQGVWRSTGLATPKSTTLGCPDAPFTGAVLDADCDNNAATVGDGVVVDKLYSGVPAADTNKNDFLNRGTDTITATQSGVDESLDLTVVGAPDNITLTALKTTIQEDSGAPCVIGGYSTNEFTQEMALPDVAGLLAKVTDDDGTALTGIWVAWGSENTSDVSLALDSVKDNTPGPDGWISPTLATEDGKIVAAPQLGCGGDVAESAKITAAIDDGAAADGIIQTSEVDDSVDLAVVAAPASLTLKPDPATIACDGTSSSVVSATILGTDGGPVVAGNAVRFDVVALGTADPIAAKTDDKGVASSKITPLSGPLAGVTVLATVDETSCTKSILVALRVSGACEWPEANATPVPAGTPTPEPALDTLKSNPCWNPCLRETTAATDIQGSVLVNCQQAAPTVAPPPPVAPTTPPIRGPNTGDGGYLP
jgi:hypothetical protein